MLKSTIHFAEVILSQSKRKQKATVFDIGVQSRFQYIGMRPHDLDIFDRKLL